MVEVASPGDKGAEVRPVSCRVRTRVYLEGNALNTPGWNIHWNCPLAEARSALPWSATPCGNRERNVLVGQSFLTL